MTKTPIKGYEAHFFILPQLLLVGYSASITNAKNKNERLSELGSDVRSSPTELAFYEGFWREELEPRFFSFFFDQAKKESKISCDTSLYREA